MPEFHFPRKDVATLSGSFEPSQFTYCFGNPSETVHFDIELEASLLIHETLKIQSTVVKGESPYDPSRYHRDTWRGDDATATGTVDGVNIRSTSDARFLQTKQLGD
jgi:hypothetical protein